MAGIQQISCGKFCTPCWNAATHVHRHVSAASAGPTRYDMKLCFAACDASNSCSGCGVYCAWLTILHMCSYECNTPVCAVVFLACCSSILYQQLKPVLCVVRAAVSSINSLTVICEKHQVLPNKRTHVSMYETLKPENKVKNRADVSGSYPVTHSGDDGVHVLDFTFQQHHPGTLSAVLVGMVQHHVEEVAELGCDARVLKKQNIVFAWQYS